MNHVAIDLGGTKSQICICDQQGVILTETSVRTLELPQYFKVLPKSRVVMETCAESFAIADAAIAAGHDVGVVPATLVRQLGVGHRGIKTDIRDARALGAASARIENLPTVHIRDQQARDHLTRLRMRDALVSARTQLINCVRGWMRTHLMNPRGGASEHFAQRVRIILADSPNGMPTYVEGLLFSIDTLNTQIEAATDEITAVAKANTVSARLQSVPGVGPMTSLAFLAMVDDATRFGSAAALQSYLGLTPGENSSSNRVRRTGITKAGPAIVRRYLTQAAITLRRTRADHPASVWARRIEERRGKQVAIIALARKLAGILFAIWRDSSRYEPTLGATAAAA